MNPSPYRVRLPAVEYNSGVRYIIPKLNVLLLGIQKLVWAKHSEAQPLPPNISSGTYLEPLSGSLSTYLLVKRAPTRNKIIPSLGYGPQV